MNVKEYIEALDRSKLSPIEKWDILVNTLKNNLIEDVVFPSDKKAKVTPTKQYKSIPTIKLFDVIKKMHRISFIKKSDCSYIVGIDEYQSLSFAKDIVIEGDDGIVEVDMKELKSLKSFELIEFKQGALYINAKKMNNRTSKPYEHSWNLDRFEHLGKFTSKFSEAKHIKTMLDKYPTTISGGNVFITDGKRMGIIKIDSEIEAVIPNNLLGIIPDGLEIELKKGIYADMAIVGGYQFIYKKLNPMPYRAILPKETDKFKECVIPDLDNDTLDKFMDKKTTLSILMEDNKLYVLRDGDVIDKLTKDIDWKDRETLKLNYEFVKSFKTNKIKHYTDRKYITYDVDGYSEIVMCMVI